MSLVLLATDPFSVTFYIIYIYCGLSDILDGFIARKSKNKSKAGALLDSAADLTLVVVALVKILPRLNLANKIIVWIILIVLIKIANMIYGYILHKKILLPHTTLNKITGLVLFVSPFIIINTNPIAFEIIICSIATIAAIQEGYHISGVNGDYCDGCG